MKGLPLDPFPGLLESGPSARDPMTPTTSNARFFFYSLCERAGRDWA